MKLNNKKVLVVDDDIKFRSLIKKLLEGQGIQVEEACDLNSTYLCLQKKFPDLILLDLELSDTESGEDFLKKRMNHNKLMQIPIIICSAHSKTSVVKKVIDLGISDYLVKPIRPDKLLIKLKKCLKSQDYLEYKFEMDEAQDNVEVVTWGEVIAIGEANCKIRSAINFGNNENLNVNMIGLEGKINSQKVCRTNMRSWACMAGAYDTLCTMVGIGENEANTLRKIKAGWGRVS